MDWGWVINELAKILKNTNKQLNMTELTQNLIERIKNYLGIKEDVDAFTLYNLIFEWIKINQPNQFGEGTREISIYNTLNNFLAELKKEIDFIQISMKPNEIATYEKNIEIVKTKSEILILKEEIENLIKNHKEEIENLNKKSNEEIESLNNKLFLKNHEIETLNHEIDNLKTDRYKESIDELKQLYKPSKSGLITLGISSVLLLFMGITTQFDSFNSYLIKVSPIDPKIIKWTLFVVLILTFINQIYSLYKKGRLRKFCDKLVSQQLISEFNNYKVKEEDLNYSKYRYFTEKDVEDFIIDKFCSHRYLKNLAYYIEKIFLINDYKSINYMKNVFIDNLLTKKYVSYGSSKNMERNFVIK